MADDDVKVEEPQPSHGKGNGKKKRNWKDEDIELFIALYEESLITASDEDYIIGGTKREEAYCQIGAQMSEK